MTTVKDLNYKISKLIWTIFKSVAITIAFGVLSNQHDIIGTGVFHSVVRTFYWIYFVASAIYILGMWYYIKARKRLIEQEVYEKMKNNQYSFFEYREFMENLRKNQQRYSNQYKYNSTTTNVKSELDIYLGVMGLDNKATDAEIKNKYRELAIKWHPDKWSLDTAENQKIANRTFQRLNGAYEIVKKHRNIK